MVRGRLVVLLINSRLLYSLVAVLCLGLGIWLALEPAIWTNVSMSTFVSGKKVVIDAGHGGIDPGAKSKNGIIEKELNLDIALRLRKHLSMVGVYCVMTRETDQDFSNEATGSFLTKKRRDLIYRIKLANLSKADIFVSIHANSFPQLIYRGAQTFYKPGDPESLKLAKSIQESLVNRLGPNNRKVKSGDYRMLNDTEMPGAMVEVGFLSNQDEAALLGQAEYRERIAAAIFHGIVNYFYTNGNCGKKDNQKQERSLP